MQKIVIFDWGGVIESHRDGEYNIRTAVIDLLKKYSGKSDEQEIMDLYYKANQLNDAMAKSSNPVLIGEWFQEIQTTLGLQCSLNEFMDSYYRDLQKVEHYEEVVKYAHSLKGICKIAIFSNLKMIDEKRIDEQVHLKEFDFVFLSFQIGYRKPEEEAYEIVEKITQMKPEDILFIDDTKANTEIAKSRGWHTCTASGYELDKIKASVASFLHTKD